MRGVSATLAAKHPFLLRSRNLWYRFVTDSDAIFRLFHLPGGQRTIAGECRVQKILRRTLLKYQLHATMSLSPGRMGVSISTIHGWDECDGQAECG